MDEAPPVKMAFHNLSGHSLTTSRHLLLVDRDTPCITAILAVLLITCHLSSHIAMRKKPPRQGKGKGLDAKSSGGKEAALEKIQRQMHHGLKVLRQALKKAKQFEVRKLCRRLQAEKEGEESGKKDCCSKKVETKRAALKALSLEDVVTRICAELGISPDGTPAGEEPPPSAAAETTPSTSDAGNHEWAITRVKGAGCVHEHLASLRSQLTSFTELRDAPPPEEAEGQDTAQGGDEDGAGLDKDDEEKEGKEEKQESRRAKSGAASPLKKGKPGRVGNAKSPGGGKRGKLPKALKKPKNRLGQRERRRLAGRPVGGYGNSARDGIRPRWDEAATRKKMDSEHSEGSRNVETFGDRNGRGLKRPRVQERWSNRAEEGNGSKHWGSVEGAQAKVDRPSVRNGGSKSAERSNAEALHPSWAAKKAQQKKLVVSAAGTKIKFDD